MNNVILIGRLTRDPEIRIGANGNVGRFTLAVPRDGRNETDFIPITVFGKTVDFTEKHLNKGKKIALSGRIQTGSYEKEGTKVYTTDVIANHIEFVESRPEGAASLDVPDDLETPFN